MSFDPYEFDRDYGQSSRMESIGQYTAKTFLWMVLGLLVTFGIALLGWVTNATLYALAYVPYIHLIVLIATIVLSKMCIRDRADAAATMSCISRSLIWRESC